MAHLVQKMAYVGETPWHQLGSQLPPKQPIEVWAHKAGMDWEIRQSPVRYMTEQAGSLGSIMTFDDQQVLYRSDTRQPLSVVGNRYQIVHAGRKAGGEGVKARGRAGGQDSFE